MSYKGDIMTTLHGDQIKQARLERGLSQEYLAVKAGISRQYVAEVENGANVTVTVLARLMKALDLRVVDIQPPDDEVPSSATSTLRLETYSVRRCIELAGLSERAVFVPPNHLDGIMRPDVLIRLANGLVVAIDAKVPRTAYDLLVEDDSDVAEDGGKRAKAKRARTLGSHARALRGAVEGWSSKEYYSRAGTAIDIHVIFVPSDYFLAAALEADSTIADLAVERGVYIVGPRALTQMLKAISATTKASAHHTEPDSESSNIPSKVSRFLSLAEDLRGNGVDALAVLRATQRHGGAPVLDVELRYLQAIKAIKQADIDVEQIERLLAAQEQIQRGSSDDSVREQSTLFSQAVDEQNPPTPNSPQQQKITS